MINKLLVRGTILAAALALTACPAKKCTSNSDCATGEVCNTSTGACETGTGGGTGGGSVGGGTGGGSVGGGGGGMDGGTGGGTAGAGDTCADAVTLTAGTALTGQEILSYSDSYSDSNVSSCNFYPYPDRAYAVTVPANNVVTITATPDVTTTDAGVSGLDITLNVADSQGSCGTTCMASADRGFGGDPETVTFANTGTTDVTYYVIVDLYNNTDTGPGTFSIEATVTPLQAGNTCDTAPTLTPGTPLTGQDFTGVVNSYGSGSGTGCAFASQSDRAYSVTVPAGQQTVVTATPDATLALTLSVADSVAACGTTCVASGQAAQAGDPASVAIYNSGSTDHTYLVIVDHFSGGTGGFSLSATAPATPGANDVCTTTTATLTNGYSSTDTLAGFTANYTSGANCFAYSGPDRVYALTLAAGEKVTTTVAPTVSVSTDAGVALDPVVNFIAGPAAACDSATTCLGGIDWGYDGATESGGFTNTSASSMDLFMAVGDYNAVSLDEGYTVTATIAPAPAGEYCGNAIVVSASGTQTGTLVDASADVRFDPSTSTCTDGTGVPDMVYSVDVPAGKTLTVTATPAASMKVAINLMDAAAAGTCTAVVDCLATAFDNTAGSAQTATHQNTGTATQTVLVQVVGVPPNTYSLNVQLQ